MESNVSDLRKLAEISRKEWEFHRSALLNEGEAWADRRGPEWDKFHKRGMIFHAAMALEYIGQAENDNLLIYVSDYIKNSSRSGFPKPHTQMDAIAEADAYCRLSNEGFLPAKKYVQKACDLLGIGRDVFQKRRQKIQPNKIVEAWRQQLFPLAPEDRLKIAERWFKDACQRHRAVVRHGK
jgi:hypothetical protein